MRTAQRATKMVTALSVVIVVFSGMPAAPAQSCIDGVTWKYCGDHVAARDLPMKFRYNPSNLPSFNSGTVNLTVEQAITLSQAQWNAAWPDATKRAPCGPLCFDGGTQSSAGRNGENTVTWGNPASCGAPGALAVTCLYYRTGTQEIVEADIILNPSFRWRIPLDHGTAVAEANGAAGGMIVRTLPFLRDDWFDVQSVLTHEFGHVLGLEHVGNANAPWPHDAVDTVRYQQTMYRWDYPVSTTKRTLAEGDIAGLLVVAASSAR